MNLANTPAYYDMELITTVESFTVLAQEEFPQNFQNFFIKKNLTRRGGRGRGYKLTTRVP
jgi:hypothetical protein